MAFRTVLQKVFQDKVRSHPISQRNSQRNARLRWGAIALSALTLSQLGFLLSSRHIPAAYAQAITDDDVTNYARTVLAIETEREMAFALASDILASADTEIDILETPLSCSKARLKDMPDLSKNDRVDLRTVLVTFCAITAAHREDEALAGRIKEEAMAIQAGSEE